MPDLSASDRRDAARAIRTYGAHVERRELRRAFTRLETKGELTDEQRATVSRMASAMVDALLEPALDVVDDPTVSDETVETIVGLYDSAETRESP